MIYKYINNKYNTMLKTNLNNLEVDYCIYNASGVNCITDNDLKELKNSKAGIILSKSCTLNNRLGNSEPRYWDNKYLSINSSGLPNNGFDFYNDYYNLDKPYFMSLSGLMKIILLC